MALGNIDLPGASTDYIESVNDASLAVTDFDIVMLVTPDDWTPASKETLSSHYDNSVAADRVWELSVKTDGTLQLIIYYDTTSQAGPSSTVATGFTDATAHWLRATYDSVNSNVKYYTSDDNTCLAGTDTDPRDAVTWTQLGTTVATPASGANTSTKPIRIGVQGTGQPWAGLFHLFALYNGYDGAGSLVSLLDVRDPDTIVQGDGSEWDDTSRANNWDLVGAGWTYTAGADCPASAAPPVPPATRRVIRSPRYGITRSASR